MNKSNLPQARPRRLSDRGSKNDLATTGVGFGAAAERFSFSVMHGWLPLAGFLLLAGVLFVTKADMWWADRLFAWEGHRWALKSSFATEELIHKIGRLLSIVAWVCTTIAWLWTLKQARFAQWRKPLAYLVVSVLVATLLVSWVKSWSNMDCPWDLLRYGGDRPYVALLQLRPVGLGRGRCFPAGHASAAYAWMSLYFFFLVVRPQWKWWGLALSAGAGLLFGFSQQVRGAHFLSHDVWTA
ncbi:MAG: phosphatase PAP2 family protein, partial [Luteimonas sp.]